MLRIASYYWSPFLILFIRLRIISLCVWVFVYVCVYVYVRALVCISVCVCVYVNIYQYIDINTNIYYMYLTHWSQETTSVRICVSTRKNTISWDMYNTSLGRLVMSALNHALYLSTSRYKTSLGRALYIINTTSYYNTSLARHLPSNPASIRVQIYMIYYYRTLM